MLFQFVTEVYSISVRLTKAALNLIWAKIWEILCLFRGWWEIRLCSLWSLFYCHSELIWSQNPGDRWFVFSFIFFFCRKCEKLQWSFKNHTGEWIWEHSFLTLQKCDNQPHCESLYICLLYFFLSNTVTMWNHTFSPNLLLHLHVWGSNTFSRSSVWECFLFFVMLLFQRTSEQLKDLSHARCIRLLPELLRTRSVVRTGISRKGTFCAQSCFYLCNPRLGQGEDISLSEPAHCLLWISKAVNEDRLGLSS